MPIALPTLRRGTKLADAGSANTEATGLGTICVGECRPKGGFAEFAVAPEAMLAHKPPQLTFAERSTLPQAGTIAFQGTTSAGSRQRVLVNGAGGGGAALGLLSGRRLGILLARQGPTYFEPVAERCVAGDLRIHIDRTFSLDEVPQALAHVGEGRALGKVVVTP